MSDIDLASLPDLALSVRQPWPWAILHAGKDVENRDWRTSRRGPVCLHAGKQLDFGDYLAVRSLISGLVELDYPGVDGFDRGGIVGVVEIVDCVSRWDDNRWFSGPFGFVLANARPVPFIPCRGELGFFRWKRGVAA